MRTPAALLVVVMMLAACSESSNTLTEPVPSEPAEATFATSAPLPSVHVDGVLDRREWKNSRTWTGLSIQLPGGGTAPGHLYVRNDRENIYFGFVLEAEVSYEYSNIMIQFLNDGVGPLAVGDDYIIGYAGSAPGTSNAFYDGYWDYTSTGFRGIGDEFTGGTIDGTAAGRVSNGQTVIEIQHPLDSGDSAHDIAVSAGDAVQFSIRTTILSGYLEGVQTTPLPWQRLNISCKRNQSDHGPDRPSRCGNGD